MTRVRRSDLESFLAALKDHPEEVTCLVFADWLQENGLTAAERARGELIRLQVRLAGMKPDDPQRLSVEDEVYQLQKDHEEQWLGPWREHASRWSFARGLLSVTVRGIDWLRGVRKEADGWLWVEHLCVEEPNLAGVNRFLRVPHLAELRSFDLRFPDNGVRAAQAVVGCPLLAGLTSLSLHYSTGPEGVRALVASPHLTRLVSLDLFACHIGDEGARLLGTWPQLAKIKRLVLQSNQITDSGVTALVASPYPGQLEDLDLCANNEITAAGVRSLAASKNLSQLRSLDLWSIRCGNEGAQALARPKRGGFRLASLSLTSANVGDEGLRALAESPRMRRLTSLRLEWNLDISAAGLRYLARSPHLSRLTSLHLHSVDAEGARALAESKHLTRLESLKMHCDGDAVRFLVAAPNFARLITLDISSANGHDEGAFALADFSTLRRLRELSFFGLTAEGVRALARWPLLRGITHLKLISTTSEGIEALLAAPSLESLRSLEVLVAKLDGRTVKKLVRAESLGRLRHLNVSRPRGLGEKARQTLEKRFGRAFQTGVTV
jgi:uncharacterized protein (TIGR02996 family)